MNKEFTEKVAFQVRHSAPGAEVEETACAKDLRWEDDCPSKEQKKASVTRVLGTKEGDGSK